MARRIKQVNVVALPTEFDAGAKDGDAAFLFLWIVIGVCRTVIDTTNAVLGAAEKQHPLGDGCLSGIDMGDDADVAKLGNIGGHICSVVLGSINQKMLGPAIGQEAGVAFRASKRHDNNVPSRIKNRDTVSAVSR